VGDGRELTRRRPRTFLYGKGQGVCMGCHSASPCPCNSQELEIHNEGFRKKESITKFSLRIYLAKEDKVGRNRNGKEKHLVLDVQQLETMKIQNGRPCPGCIYTLGLSDSILNSHLDTRSHCLANPSYFC
jgi:hypothetical protein